MGDRFNQSSRFSNLVEWIDERRSRISRFRKQTAMQRDTRYYSLIGSLIARISRTRTKKVQRVETVIGARLLRPLRRPIEIDHRERNGVSRVFRSCKHAGSSTSFPGFTLLFPSNESEKKKSRDVTRLDQRSHRFRWTRSQLQAIKNERGSMENYDRQFVELWCCFLYVGSSILLFFPAAFFVNVRHAR